MTVNREKIWRAANRALKREEFYQENREWGETDNYELMYVLAKGKHPNPDQIIAVAGMQCICYQFYPYTRDEPCELWGFNYERDLFKLLESGYEIVGMSMDCHFDVWSTIEAWQDEIETEKGMQKYLKYCRQNRITKEKIETETGLSGMMDVMTLYHPERVPKEPER